MQCLSSGESVLLLYSIAAGTLSHAPLNLQNLHIQLLFLTIEEGWYHKLALLIITESQVILLITVVSGGRMMMMKQFDIREIIVFVFRNPRRTLESGPLLARASPLRPLLYTLDESHRQNCHHDLWPVISLQNR